MRNEIVNALNNDDGVQILGGISGFEFWDGPTGDNIFNVVNDLITALKNSIDEAHPGTVQDIGTALGGFSKALDQLGQARGQIGVSLSVVDRMHAMLDTRGAALREQRSHTEDANIAEVSIRIQQLQLAMQAGISSGNIVLQQNTLFDIIG